MHELHIDLECYSAAELNHTGVYRYCEDPDFDILLFGYSVDNADVHVVDLTAGEHIPEEIIEALSDQSVIKYAHNSSYERICLSRWLTLNGYPLNNGNYSTSKDTVRAYLDPTSWRCTMVWSAYLGLPLSLAGAGAALGLEKQKLDTGKDLIRFFCRPCAPTKANNMRTRNRPSDAPEKWKQFILYNERDVVTEMEIQRKLSGYPVPEEVWQQYRQDQEINDRGILVDTGLVENAIAMDARSHEQLTGLVKEMTSLENPSSVQQMKRWLGENGMEVDSLGKKQVLELIRDAPEPLRDVLSLRLQLSKSSVKKYMAMRTAVCADDRIRGCFQFYGAARTGRYSGRLVQLQNLYRNSLPDLNTARELVRSGDFEAVDMLYGSVPDVLSELIRTAFIAPEGQLFYVADFSAIEARALAWLAGEQWRMDLFHDNGDIYCQSASAMFHVPVVKHGVNGHLRQKGKIAELACIAEGQPVLTDHGEKSIETVTTDDLVWDGSHFVQHDGVVDRGVREVILYQGLMATPDHTVYTLERPLPVSLIHACANGYTLLQSGPGATQQHDNLFRLRHTYDIVNAGPMHRFTVSGRLVHNCGYGGGVGALKAMGALEMGLTEDELLPLVRAWRGSNPAIVRLWWDVDAAAMEAVSGKTTTETHGIRFARRSGMLLVTLPSGRQLAYAKPVIGTNRFGAPSLSYMGVGGTKRWERLETYGPKLVENLTQAIARDVLCHAMKELADCRIVAHVHDELIIEAPADTSLEQLCERMGRTPPWAPGLELRADGYTAPFYMKD